MSVISRKRVVIHAVKHCGRCDRRLLPGTECIRVYGNATGSEPKRAIYVHSGDCYEEVGS